MKLAWATDIHLNFVREKDVELFCDGVKRLQASALLLSGDIAEADSLVGWLEFIEARLDIPIYFVLGNHDFYRGAITATRDSASNLDQSNLQYLPAKGPIQLTPTVSLVGQDGWGDCRIGDLENFLMMSDYFLIEDLLDTIKDAPLGGDIDRTDLVKKLQSLGDEDAEILRPHLVQAAQTSSTVLVMTHVPPFREACWNQGRISDEAWLPGFTCSAIGERLLIEADKAPDTDFVVLCGHIHSSGHVQMRPNLTVYTGFGDYRLFRIGSIEIRADGLEVYPPQKG